MFAAFVVTLKPTAPAPIGNSTGASLHALLFNLIAQENRALAEQLHADAPSKPFTVSPLRGKIKRAGERRLATPEQFYSVRYTTLADDLFNALSKILLGKFLYRGNVTLDGAEFVVQNVAVEPEKSRGWGSISSAEEIWARASSAPDIALRFASPTAFRQRGLNLLFPIPANVFHSYREKWNAFASPAIDDTFLAWVEQNVAVEAHELESRMTWFGGFQLHGFTGWCRYTAKDKDAARLKQLNALADFAFFCGTGQKTTQGMGQTRRMKAEEPALSKAKG
jgi:CRISPR-associated endoribonuclease Cas6